ncbi:hypothetical protein HY418_02215 [Candidatus Kaiserbacteria bacterium]|nr:hypothetical protein [Candidatus Kaiserbacteria bacterium]
MKNSNRGATLLEVAVWVSVFTFVLGAIVTSIIYFYRTNTYTLGQATAVSSGQRGLNNMMRVIREAAYASDGAYPIISMATSSFSFYADVDTDASIEKIRYFLQGTTLFEGVVEASGNPPVYTGAEATSTVAEYIRNIAQATSTFRYFDKNGALMSDYSKIGSVRFVTVNLVVDVDTTELPPEITLRSSAGIRNLVGY